MNAKLKLAVGAVAGLLAFALVTPTAANAAPVAASYQSSTVASADVAVDAGQLSTALESLFTDVITFDEHGLTSFDVQNATELLGAEKALELDRQLREASVASLSGMTLMATGQAYVDCIVESSVLGLIAGLVTGSFVELIREKKWDELAKKLLPRLVKSGVTGGVIGVVGSLAASAVGCAIFA